MKMLQRIYILAFLLGPVILSFQSRLVFAQSITPKAAQIEVTLVPDKPTIMLGEPIYLSFVLKNHSEEDLNITVGGDYRNALGRPESFTVTVMGQDGKTVPKPSAGMNFGGLIGPKKLPRNGDYTFRLFLPHWAMFAKPGDYVITAKRILTLRAGPINSWRLSEKGTDVEVQGETNIRVVRPDPREMGKVIRGFGNTMLEKGHSDSEAATRALSYIHDDRVIPYFIRAFKTRDSSLKYAALGALSRFEGDAAYRVLKEGIGTQGEDIGNTTSIEVANQVAENIRHAAASALAKSPHPRAIPFLLSKRNDSSEAVRMTILHVLGKMTPKRAIPILQEMSQDQNKRVSDEAKRYIQLLSSKK